MRNLYLKAVILALFLFFKCVHGQQTQTELPNYTPPSPTAYELGRFGELPIGLFTGANNVPVDLLKYKANSIEIPISLVYSSNGIQVDRLATKVGLGWNLNAGGVITRQVNHNPDEESGYLRPNNFDYNSQAWADYFYNMVFSISGHAQPLVIDSQPDIFTFNFLGHQGRFTMDNSQNQRRIIPLDNVSYDIVYDSSGNGSFKIVDASGTTYFFEAIESTRSDRIGGTGETNFLGNYIDTAWYLTRIESVNNDIVYFDYLDEEYDYVSTQSQYVRLRTNELQTRAINACSNSTYPPPYESPIINHNLLIKGKKLWRIRSNNPLNGRVEFSYGLNHSQINDYSFLTKVALKNSSSYDIETVELNYLNKNNRFFLEGLNFDDPNKTYSFEYIDLNNIPERLSKRKDHWGYYNNKPNSIIYPDIDNVFGDRVRNHFGNGANKAVDTLKSKIGLLKKVIYPTKGYSEFEYESNTYNELQEIVDYEQVYMEVATLSSQSTGGSQEIIFTSKASEKVPINIMIEGNYYGCSPIDFPATADRKLFITIQNLTFNQSDIIHKKYPVYGINGYGNSLGYTSLLSNDEYYFNLLADSQYKITIQVFYECLRGNLKFKYPSSEATYEFVNVKTGGQRISGYKNFNYSGDLLEQKKFYYAKRTNLNRSTGIKGITPQYTSQSFVSGYCSSGNLGSCIPWVQNFTTLNSGAIQALFNTDVQTIRYTDVIESLGGSNFENGGVQHTYKFARPNQPYQIFNTLAPIFSEGDLSWGDGLETERLYFKKDGTSFKDVLKEEYFFVRDNRVNETVDGYPVSLRYYQKCGSYSSGSKELVPTELNVSRYYISKNWYYLSHKKVTNFDKETAPIVTDEFYYYDNPEHGQVSRVVKSSSNERIIIQRNFYPSDINSSNLIGLDPFSPEEISSLNQLITDHRLSENIQNEVYVDKNNDEDFQPTELVSANRNIYKIDSGIVQLSAIETLKGQYNPTTNIPETRIVFGEYDSRGNPLEVKRLNGASVTYLWGYNGQYPIAKIENAKYNDVQTALGFNNTKMENLLESDFAAINNLRNQLPNAIVTTYEYDPIIGIAEITDPRGQKMTYTYDEFNRLKTVLDNEFKLLQEYKYHYKSQN